ncbi:MAG: hypothetical protein JXA20_16730 [Spirochaetes bacterium]|nr:hypothetical protein [Spirochaetota bacterium]
MFTLVNGLTLSYNSGVYGVSFPLFPILGCIIRIGERDRINVMLPLRVSYTHRFDAGLRLTALIGGERRRFCINNHSDFIYLWGRDSRISLQLSSITTGIRIEYDLSENVFIKSSAAIIAMRNITFAERRSSLYRERIAPSVYASVSAGIRFGRSELEGERE